MVTEDWSADDCGSLEVYFDDPFSYPQKTRGIRQVPYVDKENPIFKADLPAANVTRVTRLDDEME